MKSYQFVPYTTPDFGCQGLGAVVGRQNTARHFAPKGTLHRKFPTANGIAEKLNADLLRLSTGQLVADICAVHGCALSTAMAAVGIARRFRR